MVEIVHTILGSAGDNMEIISYIVSAAILMLFIDAIFSLFGSLFSRVGGYK